MENLKIQELIQSKVLECMEIVRGKFKLTTFENPSVHFDVSGTKGGFAKYQDWSIHFNLDIARKNLDEYLKLTIPHEIAHLVDYKKYNNWGHKRTWKMIMVNVFGLEPNRCHNYDVSEVQKKKYDTYIYVCKCQEHKIKSNIHKKIETLNKKYRCRKCFNHITFKEYFGKT